MTKAEVLAAAAKGEGCLGRSADDEPVFVICARDVLSDDTVRDWIRRASARNVNTAKLLDARDDAEAMRQWRETHGGGKVPD